MDHVRPTLRRYLLGVYLVAGALVVYAVIGLARAGSLAWTDLVAALVFLALAYTGERMVARVRVSIVHSMSTVMLVAAILVLPSPYPILVAVGAALAAEVGDPQPLYKRLFNVAHATIVVGGTCIAFARVASPLPHWDAVLFLSHAPSLILFGLVYAVLDLGGLQIVVALADDVDGGARVLVPDAKVALLEGVSIGMGVVSAVAWAYNPVALFLSLLPLLTVRATYRTIEQDAARAEALRQRNEQLEGVIHAGQQLRLQQTRVDLVRPLAEHARTIAGASAVAVYLQDDDDATVLEKVLTVPPGAAVDAPGLIPALSGGDDAPASPSLGDDILLIPLDADGATVGQLRLYGAIGDDVDTSYALALLANQAAVAVQNAALHERILAQVSIDGLTGLPNHRAFHARLDEEMARCRRLGQPAGLILVDVDGLAAINAAGGLTLGDASLTAVATAIRQTVRLGDIVARDGGDEFALLLLDTGREEAIDTANRIQMAVRARGTTPGGARVSLGVAAVPDHGTTRETIVRAAQQAIAGAKALGKDRIAEPDDGVGLVVDDAAHLIEDLIHANLATIKAMAAAVDAKDPYTQGHSQRVSRYAVALGRALNMTAGDLERLELAALLHDVGKIAVPDAILKKEERLTEEEFSIIKKHPVTGERMLVDLPYLSKDILPAVRHHHERWDGRGYPDGLAGGVVPPDAAIMAVADSFDAMTSTRTYRRALTGKEAARRIREGSGTQFAPHVVVAFERAFAAGDLLLEEPYSLNEARLA